MLRVTRRRCMRVLCAGAAALVAYAGFALPSVTLVFAVVLPEGSDAWRGARLATQEAEQAARLVGVELDVRWIVPAEQWSRTAATAHIVIGGATDAAAAQLARVTRELQALALDVGGRADALRTCDPLLFHIAPSAAMLRAARLQAREPPAGGDTVVSWHPALERYGAAQLNERYRRAYGSGMSEAAWAGWIAVKIAWESAQRTGSSDPRVLAAFLASERAIFDGHKGVALSFRPRTRQLRQPLYIVRDDSLLEEVPAPRLAAEMPAAEALDRLADGAVSCAP